MKPGLCGEQDAIVFHNVGGNMQFQVIHLVSEGSCVAEEDAGRQWFV